MTTEPDRYVVRGGEEFTASWLAAAPIGVAWRKSLDSTTYKFARGLNEIYGYVCRRLDDLISIEADPRVTYELLEEWERAFGLPDPCLTAPPTTEGRQAALVEKMTSLGGQSVEYFYSIAAKLGYDITIREHSPFMAGYHEIGGTLEEPIGFDLMTEDGDDIVTEDDEEIGTGPMGPLVGYYPEIGDYEIRYYWTVHVGERPFFWFRVGSGFPNAGPGEAGVDPHLTINAATDLECIFERLKPAHTIVVFDYTGLPVPDPEAGLP